MEKAALEIVRDVGALMRFADDWARLAADEPRHCPAFADLAHDLAAAEGGFRLVIARNGETVAAMACFVLARVRRGFWLGERRLFALPLNQAELVGATILGGPDAELAGAMLAPVLRDRGIGYVSFGDVDRASGLYRAIRRRRVGWIRQESGWRATRRVIRLDGTYAEWLAGLPSARRRSFQRDERLFLALSPEIRVMTRPDEMAGLLAGAATVAQRTYQARFGMAIDASGWRLERYRRQATRGDFVGFLALVGGEPAAFWCGDIAHGVFHARFTGYDPAHARACVGTGMLLQVLRHLADNGLCRRFDFGVRDMDYKRWFANEALDCRNLALGSIRHPAAALAVTFDRASAALKPLVLKLAGGAKGLQRIKKRLRGRPAPT